MYIDDILIFSDSLKDHVKDVQKLLIALRKAGLKGKKSKCQWGLKYVEYLGHKIGNGQMAVPEHRITAMKEFVQPKSKKDLRAFLGSIGYYRKFIPNFADHSSVLSPSTSSKAHGKIA